MNVTMEENKEEVSREGKARGISKKSRENARLSTQSSSGNSHTIRHVLKESNDQSDVSLP